MLHPRPIPILLAFIILIAGSVAWACSVPVFRYALEHWTSDPFQAVIFHRGHISETERDLIHRLGTGGNIRAEVVDVSSSPSPAMAEPWKQAGSPAGPWLVIKAPRSLPHSTPLWSSPLNEDAIKVVLDSPARTEIARRIGDGESAVWILLESGNKAKDDEAAKLLNERLAYLSTVLALPKLDDQDIKNGLVSVPDEGLKLAFSTLRISRGDPSEKFFIPLLLATEKDLKAQDSPIVFPVFGQARVLYALVGKGINHNTIDDAASFLIGSCSCQVKEQNPGADLLMSVDWKKILKDQSLGAQDLPKVSDIVSAMPEAVTITARPASTPTDASYCCSLRSLVAEHQLLTVSIVSPALLLLGWLLIRKQR